jgi:hypothetical protein
VEVPPLLDVLSPNFGGGLMDQPLDPSDWQAVSTLLVRLTTTQRISIRKAWQPKCLHHRVELLKKSGSAIASLDNIAASRIKLPTARSRTPSPNGENMRGLL